MKRTRLKPMSAKKRREIRESRPTVAEVFARDEGCVLRRHQHLTGDCWGDLTPHHIVKQSRERGRWDAARLVAACEFHNGTWIEGHPIEARELGLVARSADELPECWRLMRQAGLAVGPQDLGGEAT